MENTHAKKCKSNFPNEIGEQRNPEARADCDCDCYHTFDELYDHRITLFITLCSFITTRYEQDHFMEMYEVWRSKRHSDGELSFGTGTQYVLGIGKEKGEQITYHIPIERWNETDFAETLDKAPEFDGHTSDDVLERLKKL